MVLNSAGARAASHSDDEERCCLVALSLGDLRLHGVLGYQLCTEAKVLHLFDNGGRRHSELGGLLLALHAVHDDKDALILSDNESVLQQIRRWIGEGCKATLANTSDADILREILTLLHSRIRAGSATYLVKVKSHRGEPLNERADVLAEQGRQRSENDKQWNARTERPEQTPEHCRSGCFPGSVPIGLRCPRVAAMALLVF